MTVDPFVDEEGDPYEPYTQEELAIMWQTHHPQAEDGDSWFTGRWLATVKELQGQVDALRKYAVRYAFHLYDCPRTASLNAPCTCGYTEASTLEEG